jgi:hypothetical protein
MKRQKGKNIFTYEEIERKEYFFTYEGVERKECVIHIKR